MLWIIVILLAIIALLLIFFLILIGDIKLSINTLHHKYPTETLREMNDTVYQIKEKVEQRPDSAQIIDIDDKLSHLIYQIEEKLSIKLDVENIREELNTLYRTKKDYGFHVQ